MPRRFGAIRHKHTATSEWIEASYLTPTWAFHQWPGLKERQYRNFDAADEDGARAWLRDAKLQIEAKAWQPEQEVKRDKQRETLTFSEYFVSWLEARRTSAGERLEEGSRYTLRKSAENHVLPAFATKRLVDITSRDVDRWWDNLDHTQTSMCLNALKVLKAVLATASSPGPDGQKPLIESNPCHIKAPKPQRETRTVPATAGQLAIIRDAMPERYRDAIYLSVFCNGLRIGEVCALRRKDLDLETLTLHVRGSRKTIGKQLVGKTKTPKSVRDEDIPPQLKPSLQQLLSQVAPSPDAWVFTSVTDKTRPLHPNTLRSMYDLARRKADRPDLRFHDLRHTALTLLAQQGATVRELMDAAGHSNPEIAMRYQHSVQNRSRALAEQLGQLIPTPDTVDSLRSQIWENYLKIQALQQENKQLGERIAHLSQA